MWLYLQLEQHYYYYPDVGSHSQLSVWIYPLSPVLHYNLLTKFSYGTKESGRQPPLIPHKSLLGTSIFSSRGDCTLRTMILHHRPLTIIYHILSQTNPTVLIADILWYTKILVLIDVLLFLSKKIIISCSYSIHLTSCTPTKYNLYLAISVVTGVSDPYLCRLLTFHVPNLFSLFHCLGCSEGTFQARSICTHFVTRPVFKVRIC